MTRTLPPAAALTLVLAAGAMIGCGADAPAEERTAIPLVTAERRTLEVRAEAAGLLEPILRVEVKSRASGAVLALHVETGDEVERGELLAEIDPRDVRNALAQAEADLEVAEATLATATSQYERAQELNEANVITEQELEAAALEQANARAQVVKARTNLELAEVSMGDVTIRAPIDGMILSDSVEVGQIIVSAGSNVSGGTTLLVMADLNEMQVRTLVDETDIGRLTPGQTARVAVEAYPGRTFIGEVRKIEPQAVVEENVTMFPVLVRLNNDQGLLKPGMNAEVEIEIGRREDVVAVPSTAVALASNAAEVALALGLDESSITAAFGGTDEGWDGAGRGAPAEQQATLADNGGAAEGERADGDRGTGEDGGMDNDRSGNNEQGALAADPGRARRQGVGAGAGFAGSAGGTAGIVFVATPTGPEPRRVVLGMSDWEYTEIVEGLEPGEQVYTATVALLQQQQNEFADRIRERAGGIVPGS